MEQTTLILKPPHVVATTCKIFCRSLWPCLISFYPTHFHFPSRLKHKINKKWYAHEKFLVFLLEQNDFALHMLWLPPPPPKWTPFKYLRILHSIYVHIHIAEANREGMKRPNFISLRCQKFLSSILSTSKRL